MNVFPKDGSSFVVESIDRTAYRWAKYKPQGAKQMGKPGRWQKRVWHGDFFKWENCEEPSGEIAPLSKDGPISAAFKGHASLLSEYERVKKEEARASASLTGLLQAIKHHTGFDHGIMGIRSLVDRSEALEAENKRLREALEPFAAAGKLALISGRPPGEHVDANAFVAAIDVLEASNAHP